jgi:DNA-nicking Smr family endonuclease
MYSRIGIVDIFCKYKFFFWGLTSAVHVRDYNHADDAEYKRLRDLAEQEFQRKKDCSHRSQLAYQEGNGAEAKQLSEQANNHKLKAEQYNRQAGEFVFRANNADSASDEIDLHGLYIKEATSMLETRINASVARNESHLKVIVGKGNHSENHIAKLKPAVEELCQSRGIKHWVDQHNAGVIVLEFANQYPQQTHLPYVGSQPAHSQPVYGQQNYHQQQQQQQPPQQSETDGILVQIFCGLFKVFSKQCA